MAGVERPEWDDYFLDIAVAVSRRATCRRKVVGAVIVKDNRILVTGYNGSPPGEPHCIDADCLIDHGHCVRTVHAEANAIATAARFGVSLNGAILYSTLEPCRRCWNLCLSAGITRCEWREDYG